MRCGEGREDIKLRKKMKQKRKVKSYKEKHQKLTTTTIYQEDKEYSKIRIKEGKREKQGKEKYNKFQLNLMRIIIYEE